MTDRRDPRDSTGTSIGAFTIPGVLSVKGPEDLASVQLFLGNNPDAKEALLERLRGREERANAFPRDSAVQELVRQMRERVAAGSASPMSPSHRNQRPAAASAHHVDLRSARPDRCDGAR